MCGRFVITSAPEALRKLFGYMDQPNFPPRYNVAPTQPVPVVIVENGARQFRLMRWGFIPAWVKDPRGFALLINARAETVQDKPAFKNAIRRRRCLIPADGWYEWSQADARKQPYFLHRSDGQPFGFAGLAETWIGPNGEELDTVAIVTAAARADMATLHSRVPVTIAHADFGRWLDCTGDNAGDALPMLAAPPEGEFVWHQVSTRVNRTANDDAQLVLPISPLEAEAERQSAAKILPRKRAVAASGGEGQGSLF
jgi:putative SOS response-associated peptidase YedK